MHARYARGMTARQDMLDGRLYDARDPELVTMRRHARALSRAFEASTDDAERERILRELLGGAGANVVVEPRSASTTAVTSSPARTSTSARDA